jgi:hypothetical protein
VAFGDRYDAFDAQESGTPSWNCPPKLKPVLGV